MHEERGFKENYLQRLAAAFAGYSQTCIYYNIKDGLYEALYEYCLRVNYRVKIMSTRLVDWDNTHTIIELSKLYSSEEFDDMLKDIHQRMGRTKYSKKIINESLKELLKTEDMGYVERKILKR